jgi:hypothetical protein
VKAAVRETDAERIANGDVPQPSDEGTVLPLGDRIPATEGRKGTHRIESARDGG